MSTGSLQKGLVSPRRDRLKIRNEVTELNVEHGIGQITNECSCFYPNVKKVNLPKSLKVIGDKAFYGCKDLESITLPDSVEYIGNYAFVGCAIKTVNVPQNLHTYHRDMFACNSLKKVIIDRENLAEIVDLNIEAVFGGTNIERVKVGTITYTPREFHRVFCIGNPKQFSFDNCLRVFWGSPFALGLSKAEVIHKDKTA